MVLVLKHQIDNFNQAQAWVFLGYYYNSYGSNMGSNKNMHTHSCVFINELSVLLLLHFVRLTLWSFANVNGSNAAACSSFSSAAAGFDKYVVKNTLKNCQKTLTICLSCLFLFFYNPFIYEGIFECVSYRLAFIIMFYFILLFCMKSFHPFNSCL